MPFRYNLQKILNFRITKRDEQIEVVKRAQLEVDKIQAEINKKYREVASVQNDMRHAEPIMLDFYDKYIKHLYVQIAELEVQKEEAVKKLKEEQDILTEYEQNVKVLEKHKERKKEEYLKEEKEKELKQLNETASIKHFRKQKEQQEEAELEEYLQQLQDEQDEY